MLDGFTKTRKTKQKTIHAVDLFCGAGGTSTGMLAAIEDLGLTPQLVAINHWDVAIATHYKNHPDVKHLQSGIENVKPEDVVPGGRLQLLVASPECTHHSNARGGKPRSDQKRADAWLLMRWINNLYIENILIENVKEFESWGPLTAKGLPDKRYKGQYFQQFIAALRVNYNVEYRILNCADYGDPTTRERLFILARRNGKKIRWPERSHASRKELAKMAAQPDLFPVSTILKPWVPAREIIDWTIEGKSIFGRKKPLSPNTMRRIFKGLEKHGLKTFLVNLKNNDRRDRSVDEPTFTQTTSNEPRDIDNPVPTITTTSRGIGVVEPFIVATGHTTANGTNSRDIGEPVPSILTSPRVGVVEVEPFTLSVERARTNRSGPRPIEDPIATITGTPRIGIVEGEVQPFTISAGGPELEAKSVEEPLRTVLTREHQAIVEAFLVKFHGGVNAENRNYPVDEPLGTLDTSNRFGLVETEPFIVSAAHGGNTNPARSVDEPLGAVLGSPKFGVVETEPFIVPFFGERNGQEPRTRDINEPAPTVTTHGRMGVVESDAFLLGQQSGSALRSVDEPVPTVASSGNIAKVDVEPYLIKFYGNGDGTESIDSPLPTVTAKDRFALCIPILGIALDIRFRMLQPRELAGAMSFPNDYEFEGNREAVVKQIGNSVPLRTAKALTTVLLT
jgi:DNA (cytosine-5)-methyltransferase 1